MPAPRSLMLMQCVSPPAAVGERDDAQRIMRIALQDIAGAEAIPNDAQAFIWCRTVANDALTAMRYQSVKETN